MSTDNKREIKFPEEWEPRPIDIKSGWKNNPKFLSEVVKDLNDCIYIPDENEMMEKVDYILEYLKSKYKITPL